jgi:DNA-binding MarR family transcriptional regulator
MPIVAGVDPGATVAAFLELGKEERFSLSADGCAGQLLEIVPLIMRAVRNIHTEQALDLTVPQFRALLFVQRHRGASLSETSEFLGLTLPSSSKLVDQLVKRRFLDRENDPEDRRRMVLRLTARGNALLKNAHSAVRARLAEILKGLSPAELATLHDTLGLLQRSFPEMPAVETTVTELSPSRKQ